MINLSEQEKFFQSDFLDDDLTVTIPRILKSYTKSDGVVELVVDSIITQKTLITVSALMQARSFEYTYKHIDSVIRIEFVKDDVIRIRQNLGTKIIEKLQPMLVNEPEINSSPTIIETDYKIQLVTNKMKIDIIKNPFKINIFDEKGEKIIEQYNDDMHSVVQDRRRGFKEDGSVTEDNLKEKYSFPSMECFPSGCVKNNINSKFAWNFTSYTHYNENFYGLGEQFGKINKSGQNIPIWTVNPVGVSSSKAYKPIPFFMSSKGYGIYSNSPRKSMFEMGRQYYKTWTCQVQDELLDIFLFVGDYTKILSEYTNITGKCIMPPKWSFGVWMSRNCYRSSDEMIEVATKLRKEELPCDVMHLDWAYCKGEFDFDFDKSRFPSPKKLCDDLDAKGFNISIWNLPYQKFSSPIYEEGVRKSAFAMDTCGNVADVEAKEAIIDFSSKNGQEFYKDKIRPLLEAGIKVIKTDFGENAQEQLVYKEYDGDDMHNLYPLLYNKTAFEVCREVRGDDFLLWGRSAFAGCQRYPIFWGGDSDSDYLGMYHTLRGGLSIGLSGFPLWSHDVGGYFCTPDVNVYIRWLQFGMFSPLVRFHGTSEREPWAYGQAAVDQYKKYSEYRYRLMEYIYDQSNKCISDSTPLMRALVLDYPHDKNVENIDTQYMFGRDILVAPVFSDSFETQVYLPNGNSWVCFHTNKIYDGGRWITVDTPIDIMPIFIKSGVIIPLVDSMQYVNEKLYKNLELISILQDGHSSTSLVTDKLDLECTISLTDTTLKVDIDIKQNLQTTVKVYVQDITSVNVNGMSINFSSCDNVTIFKI